MTNQLRNKEILEIALHAKQDRTLLIYNIVDYCCNNKQEVLDMLKSELKQLGVFKNE